jgi:hypothetical protein
MVQGTTAGNGSPTKLRDEALDRVLDKLSAG